MLNTNEKPVQVVEGIGETKESAGAAKYLEKVRAEIVRLEGELAERPTDVALLTALMRAYRTVGNEERLWEVMRTLRDIPSKADVKEEARALVKAAADWQDGELVDVDALRSKFADVFRLIESRQEIRPADVMDAMGCGCSFAIDVLLVFVRLGIVLQDRGMGLRDVAASKPTGMVSLRPARSAEEVRMGRCADMKRELEAFRELASLELKLEEWPQAIPLMERALRLYDMTHQPIKREAIRKRLEAVDPTNPNVTKYFEVEERLARKAAAEKIRKMSDDQRQTLEQARALVKEAGRCSTSMLQRQMGISYNQAVRLVEILRSEQK